MLFQSLSDNDLPQHICAICLNTLENVYSFHVKVYESDTKLLMNGNQCEIRVLPDTVNDQSNEHILIGKRIDRDNAIELDTFSGEILKAVNLTEPIVMDERFLKPVLPAQGEPSHLPLTRSVSADAESLLHGSSGDTIVRKVRQVKSSTKCKLFSIKFQCRLNLYLRDRMKSNVNCLANEKLKNSLNAKSMNFRTKHIRL